MTTTIFTAYEVTEILRGEGVIISRNDEKFISESLQKNNRFVYRCGRGKGEKVFEFITPDYIAPEDVEEVTNRALSDALTDVILNQYLADTVADYEGEALEVVTSAIAHAYNDYIHGLASVSPVARDY